MNNPLKYVDPSGRVVEIIDWDVRYIDAMFDAFDPTMMFQMMEFLNSERYQIYQAYDAFRNLGDTARVMATSMEDDTTHKVIIRSDESNYYWHDPVDREGNTFTMTLNSEMFMPLVGLDKTWKQGMFSIYDAVAIGDQRILKTSPDWDWWSVIGGAAQGGIPFKKTSAVVSGLDSALRTDQTLSNIGVLAAGLINPVFGAVAGGLSELIRQQDFYDWWCVNVIGYYPFVD